MPLEGLDDWFSDGLSQNIDFAPQTHFGVVVDSPRNRERGKFQTDHAVQQQRHKNFDLVIFHTTKLAPIPGDSHVHVLV